jgi:3-oxoadipate enol-lactonase
LAFVSIDGLRVYYRLEGAEARPVLVLSHSLGLDHGMWAPQMSDLLHYFRVLRYDTRGHGASDAPSGDYSVEQLAQDVLGLANALKIGEFAFCGLSLGGMVGQWLAAHAPDRLTHLILANTSARTDGSIMETRRQVVMASGMPAVQGLAMPRWFSAETLAEDDPTVDTARRTLLATDSAGYAGCCAAIRDMDQRTLLPSIRVPTLVIAGDSDVATPWSGHGEELAREIPNARAVHLKAAHLSNLERPGSFTSALLEFLLQDIG